MFVNLVFIFAIGSPMGVFFATKIIHIINLFPNVYMIAMQFTKK